MSKVFESLDEALAEPDRCHELELTLGPNDELPTSLIVLTQLDSLRVHIHGGRRAASEQHEPSTARFRLPAWIGRLRGLRSLEIDGEVVSVPESIGQLDTLERLCLRSAGAFPPAIARLVNLRELDLRVDTLATTPLAMRELDRLEVVRVQVGRMLALPLGLLALTNLRVLVVEVEDQLAGSRDQSSHASEGPIPLELGEFDGKPLPPLLPGLRRLEELSVLGWQLDSLPPVLLALRQLRSLTLRRCGLRELPEGWAALERLRKLDLCENQLEQLPSSIGQLSELRELVVSHNPLRTIPAQLGRLARLERLDLDGCRMASLPSELGGASKLQVLQMADTRTLAELPESLLQLSELTTLDLAGAALQELPGWLFELPRLESLRLQGNFIRTLPDSLFTNRTIEQLDLRNNPLELDQREMLEELRVTRALLGFPIDLVW